MVRSKRSLRPSFHTFAKDASFRWIWLAGLGLALAAGGMAGPASAPSIGVWLMVVLVYPVLEELAFRGALQGWFERYLSGNFGPVTHANFLTSALFAFCHWCLIPQLSALLVFLPSLAFGWTRDRHRTVSGSIFLHTTWNLFFMVGAWLQVL